MPPDQLKSRLPDGASPQVPVLGLVQSPHCPLSKQLLRLAARELSFSVQQLPEVKPPDLNQVKVVFIFLVKVATRTPPLRELSPFRKPPGWAFFLPLCSALQTAEEKGKPALGHSLRRKKPHVAGYAAWLFSTAASSPLTVPSAPRYGPPSVHWTKPRVHPLKRPGWLVCLYVSVRECTPMYTRAQAGTVGTGMQQAGHCTFRLFASVTGQMLNFTLCGVLT